MSEVLVSLSLVIIGGAGVISMQRATIQGNIDARRMDMANAIARQWIERLRADATLWTLPSARNGSSNFTNAPLLQRVHLRDNKWYRPDQRLTSAPFWSPGMDPLGTDVPQGRMSDGDNYDTLFCTNVRLNWLIDNQILRADVRVFWPRGVGAAPDKSFCGQDPPDDLETRTDRYHFVYAMTAIRRNAVR